MRFSPAGFGVEQNKVCGIGACRFRLNRSKRGCVGQFRLPDEHTLQKTHIGRITVPEALMSARAQ